MTTKNITVDADEIDSTFQKLNIQDDHRFPSYVTEAYEGTHVFNEYAVTTTFTVERHDHGTERVSVYRRYDVGGEEVNCGEQTWELTDDGEHVEHSGEAIEEFCRSNHFGDPQLEIEQVIADA